MSQSTSSMYITVYYASSYMRRIRKAPKYISMNLNEIATCGHPLSIYQSWLSRARSEFERAQGLEAEARIYRHQTPMARL